MKSNQEVINEIIKGDITEIISGIKSDNPIVVANAIIYGTKFNLNDLEFNERLKYLKNSDEEVLNIPIKSLANASLSLLGIEKYTGDDAFTLRLIDNHFGID